MKAEELIKLLQQAPERDVVVVTKDGYYSHISTVTIEKVLCESKQDGKLVLRLK